MVLCEFHIMHPKPIHLSHPSHWPSILETSPTTEENKSCGSYSVSQCVPQHTLLSTYLSLLAKLIAMAPWSCMKPLASATLSTLDPHWYFSWLSCYSSLAWRFCSFGSVRLATSCTPDAHQWGRCWDEPIQSPGPGPERYLGCSAS